MTILSGDIKFAASKVMDDVPEGGGGPTDTIITDGTSNAIFPDVSELDRAGGRVSLRKVFVRVDTDNRDTYLGSNVIIASPPEDPLVAVSMFSTGEVFDTRDSAKNRMESYLTPGPEWSGFLFENHIAGQSSVRIFQRPGYPLPRIGQTLVLVYNEGQVSEVKQYVRITDIDATDSTFTYVEGSTPKDYTATVVTCDISDSLRYDFLGSAHNRLFQRESNKSKIRDTVVANASRYYGVTPLTDAVSIGDVSAKVDTIFTQLVPNAQTEIPLIDQNPTGQAEAIVNSANGTVSYTTSTSFGPGSALSTGNPIKPESLSITTSGGTLTDYGGQLYAGATVIGTVDYPRGTILIATGAPTYSGSKTVTFTPAAAPIRLCDSAIVNVTAENRGFNYILTILPAPAPGTTLISYRSNGRWYDLRDNGSGQLKGADSTFGAGTVSYSTGTIAVTLGALPDTDSAILYQWGEKAEFIDRSGTSVPAVQWTMNLTAPAEMGGNIQQPDPTGITVAWSQGASDYELTDAAGNGVLTGTGGSGTINYKTGALTITPTNLPNSSVTVDATFTRRVGGYFTVTNPAREVDTTVTMNLGSTGIKPGSVYLTWDTEAYDISDSEGFVFQTQNSQAAKDDGSGNIKIGAVTVGAINYTTGIITAFQPNVVQSLPIPEYEWVYRGLGSGTTLADNVRVLTGYNYENRTTAMDITKPIKVWFIQTIASSTTINESFDQASIKLDLSTNFSEIIVPGSVNFTVGSLRYFDRSGSLYHSLNVIDGSATLAGTINYQTGECVINSWASGANSVAVRSLLTQIESSLVMKVSFRIPIAPVRPGSLQILATKAAGGSINVIANNDGTISGTGVIGSVNYETGVVSLRFGTRVTASTVTSEPWYDADLVDGEGKILRPEYVFADTIKFNAVAFTYLPLDASILGLDPVRLPQDGRVPMFRLGGFVVMGNTATTSPGAVSNGTVVNCGRTRLSRVRVLGNNNAVITAGYTADLEAGTVTFTNVTGYSQPVRVEHRVEDLLQVSDVQINGELGFTRQITHAYPEGTSYVSSALVTGDLKARVSLMFDQATWDGITWLDTLSGSAASATYNDIAGPVVVTNDGAVTERWAFKFTSTTAFQVVGEHVGVIDTGSINTETAPINPATGTPYFTVPTTGWGTGWAIGNIVRMNTVGATVPVWLVRTVQQGPESTDQHSFTIIARGDVDAP